MLPLLRLLSLLLLSLALVPSASNAQLAEERVPVLIDLAHTSSTPFLAPARLLTVYSDGLVTLSRSGGAGWCWPDFLLNDPIIPSPPDISVPYDDLAIDAPLAQDDLTQSSTMPPLDDHLVPVLCDTFISVQVSPDSVEDLMLDLRDLGIHRLSGPQGDFAPPLSLRTITCFRPATRGSHKRFWSASFSRTFSYQVASEEILPIEERIEEFLDDHVL